jgi:hypothetical protein
MVFIFAPAPALLLLVALCAFACDVFMRFGADDDGNSLDLSGNKALVGTCESINSDENIVDPAGNKGIAPSTPAATFVSMRLKPSLLSPKPKSATQSTWLFVGIPPPAPVVLLLLPLLLLLLILLLAKEAQVLSS